MASPIRLATLFPVAIATAALALPACSSDFHDDSQLPAPLPTTSDTLTPDEQAQIENAGLDVADVEIADLGEGEGEEGAEAPPPEEDPPGGDPPPEDDPPEDDPPLDPEDPLIEEPLDDLWDDTGEGGFGAEAFIDDGELEAEPPPNANGQVTIAKGKRCSGSSLNCDVPLTKVRSLCPAKYQSNENFWTGKNILKVAPKGSSYEKNIGKPEKRRFLTPGGGLYWPVEPNTVVVDGFGRPIGNLAVKNVMINYGMRKVVGGRIHVLAFAPQLATPSPDYDGQRAGYQRPASGKVTSTGWIPQGAVHPAILCMPTLAKPATVPTGATKRPRLNSDTCSGDMYVRTKSECIDGSVFGKKTAAKVSTNSANATDYVLNDGGVHNVLWSTPLVGGSAKDVIYADPTYGIEYAAKPGAKVPVLRLRLYAKGATAATGSMLYTYVRIKHPKGPAQYGWISLPQVANTAPLAAEQDAGCKGKTRSKTYCDATGQPFFCTSGGFLSRGKPCNPGSVCRTDPDDPDGAAEVDEETNQAVCYAVE